MINRQVGLKTVLCGICFGAKMTGISGKSAKMATGHVIFHSTSPADDLSADGTPPCLWIQWIDQLHIFGHVYHKINLLIDSQNSLFYTEGCHFITLYCCDIKPYGSANCF